MSNIECCGLPSSGLADYSPFQNELPHFDDDETYSQLNNNILPCQYYDELSSPSGQQHSSLVLLINIRSLQKNFDDFYNLLCSLPQPIVIIALSETRVNLHPLSNIEIPGYTFYFSNSPSKAGGVGVYVSNLVSSDTTNKYCLKTEKCEELWLNVKLDSKLYFVIGTLYRHPGSNTLVFCEKLNATLSNLNKSNKKILILGDLNLNTTGCNQHPHAKDHLNILSSNAAFPLIIKPTRITSTSSTLLDHIITNITQNTLLPGILRSDLSDHFPTFCFILLDSKPFKITVNKKIRSLNKFKPEDYVQELALKLDQFFSHLPEVSSTNFDAIFKEFYHIIKTITNTHAPLKLLPRKQKRLNSKPWITKGILISIKCKKKLYWSDYVNGNEVAESLYKIYANKLKQIIRLAK